MFCLQPRLMCKGIGISIRKRSEYFTTDCRWKDVCSNVPCG
ncbi:hypothetical protein HanHA300_Chr14g0531811 [Helianthus annuus]|nr:hypothetical protein HanHA300_Chr14g0531811 [Helianthus annuus]KAJ0486436.1 hypothetical protein HanHA89_Chr14g0579611 [Helianthus annuus]KAJ0657001.1 hypothetical protein HanLR1_Chr14g0542171 [Helianthus annuus]KAJ0660586.1 hypothetical protein HanOQP8_Chr14g0539381 [Helianthus annuus]